MPPIKTDFKRKSGLRDARLFVIATEGSDTEKIYFEALKNTFIHTRSRVQIEVLNRVDFGINANNSSPIDVLKTLDEFKKRYHLKSDDQLWLVIDRDCQNIKDKGLSEIVQQIIQKKYFLALSNPCFELWLVLHFENPNGFDEAKCAEYLKNEKENKKNDPKRLLEKKLADYLDGYKKSAFNTALLMERINQALEHAKMLPMLEGERWHSNLGTQVWALVEELVPPSELIGTN